MIKQHGVFFLITLIAVLLLSILISLGIGRYPLTLHQTITLLFEPLMGAGSTDMGTIDRQIIWQVRLPRILLSVAVGAGLAISGAALQGVFRNPLVGPQIIGVSSGAAFGGTLAILLSLSSIGLFIAAFIFGMLSLLLIYTMTTALSRRNILSLMLAGIILSGFFSALVSLLQYLADIEDKLPSIVFWLLGSFATATTNKLWLMAIPLLIAGGLLLALRWRINLLSLGEDDARAMGERVELTRWLVLTLTTIIVAAQVAVSGSIGWVGLVIPHLARILVGPDHRILLPVSMALGSIYMLLIDNLARTLTSNEIPLGILTALIGAPLFALLLHRAQKRGWNG